VESQTLRTGGLMKGGILKLGGRGLSFLTQGVGLPTRRGLSYQAREKKKKNLGVFDTWKREGKSSLIFFL